MRKKNTRSIKTRITVDLSVTAYKRLGKLKKLIDAVSYVAVIRQALCLYEFLAKEAGAGKKVYITTSLDDSTLTEVQLFPFKG